MSVIVLVANKEDLPWSSSLSESAAQEWASSLGAIYRRTSAKTKYGVEQLFKAVGTRLFPAGQAERSFGRESIKLTSMKPARGKKCC